jgi:biopolymer transport protein ExbD
MNFLPARKGRMLLINVTSLIDVMFLLVIFLMATSTFNYQPAINLVLPRSATAVSAAETPSVLYLTKDGRVFLNEKQVDDAQLAEALKGLQAASGDDTMVLRADEKAEHGDVVHLIDILKQSGFTRVSISARGPQSE